MKKYYLALLSVACMASAARSQQFTKITGNLITNNTITSWGNSWVDFNNDGLLDLFVNDYAEHRLYQNNGGGVFTDVTPAVITTAIAAVGGGCYTSTWGDYNNDGYLDLYMATDGGKHLLFKGSATGFTRITTGPEVTELNQNTFNCSWVDYNNDGFLDMFNSNLGPTANTTQPNNLYKNNGGTSFTKVTTGNIVTDVDQAWGHAWADYNNDRCPDLFVANLTNNFLYLNNCDGTFTKVISGPVVNDGVDCQGGSWGDYNNDGYLDLFVAVWQNHCLLFRNNGNGSFTKVVGTPFDTSISQSTGSGWADYDNDGYLDLYVCAWDEAGHTHNRLYHNNGDGTFAEITNEAMATSIQATNGCSWADYDNDGFQDLYVTNHNIDNFLFHNNGNSNSWVNIKCVGITSNKTAIGTKIRVKANVNGTEMWQMREIGGSMSGQFAESGMNAAMGFGNATMLDSVIIEWPLGATCKYANLPVNKFYVMTEDCTFDTAALAVNNIIHNNAQSVSNNPNPFRDLTHISYTTTATCDVSIEVTDMSGRKVISVQNKNLQPGKYETVITSQQLNAPGVYFYTLTAGKQVFTGKMIYTGN